MVRLQFERARVVADSIPKPSDVPKTTCTTGISLRIFRIAVDVIREEGDPFFVPFRKESRCIEGVQGICDCVRVGDRVPRSKSLVAAKFVLRRTSQVAGRRVHVEEAVTAVQR